MLSPAKSTLPQLPPRGNESGGGDAVAGSASADSGDGGAGLAAGGSGGGGDAGSGAGGAGGAGAVDAVPLGPCMLYVHLLEGRSLQAKDANGSSDPFVRCVYQDQTKRTAKVSDELSPTWDVSVAPLIRTFETARWSHARICTAALSLEVLQQIRRVRHIYSGTRVKCGGWLHRR